jgi:uncharacterized protein YndB with AHSA1/START domain
MFVARVDRASALIKASRMRVYEAFIDAEAVLHWLPPSGARGSMEAFDPRPGGAFRMTLVFDGTASATKAKTSAKSDTVEGKFVNLIAPELIVQQFNFVSDDPAFAGSMMMTWALFETPFGTLVTVMATNVPVGISAEEHKAGMSSSLANLAAYVETSNAVLD